MQKYLATLLVVIAAGAAFWFGGVSGTSGGTKLGHVSLPFSFSKPSLSTITNAFNSAAAWGVFEEYLKAAKAHDLATVKNLSYQISPTCADESKKEECYVLMDSVYMIASGFKQQDFVNIAADDKQIVMSTDYMTLAQDVAKTKVVLYFVKATDGSPKVLGIRFCYGDEKESEECVRTEPDTRDLDKDGWWDDVQFMFRK